MFSSGESQSCERCNILKKTCIVEKRVDELNWKSQTDNRLDRLEKSLNRLINNFEAIYADKVQNQLESRDLPSPTGESVVGKQVGIRDKQIDEIFTYFNKNLSKYLPIFIFDYIPPLNKDIKRVSDLLYKAVMSVTSLYLPKYQDLHTEYLRQFKERVDSLSPPEIYDDNGKPYNLRGVTHDLLGCVIAAAWLGNEIGARCCMIAGDIAGRLNPQVLESMGTDESNMKMTFAFSLASYIIERRLLISYTRSEFSDMNNSMSINRDYFLPLYLNKIFIQDNDDYPKSTEYKVNANVELCALTMMFQQETRKIHGTVDNKTINKWTQKLDTWLADWIGKLTTHLDSSTLKPLILTFHFSKLYLNVQAVNNISSLSNDSEGILTRSENVALDIVEMLFIDRDIRRLIKLAPVFYPTIFVTAAALLLKIVTLGPKYGYKVNNTHLLRTSQQVYDILASVISSSLLPCHTSVKSLGEGIESVGKRLEKSNNSLIANEILESDYPVSSDLPILKTNSLNDDLLVAPSIPIVDYKEIWEMDMNILWDGFNADLMKSLYDSPNTQ